MQLFGIPGPFLVVCFYKVRGLSTACSRQLTGKGSLEDRASSGTSVNEFYPHATVTCSHQYMKERLGSDWVPKRKGLLVAEPAASV